ncbi:unnamed protein product [Dibothriocephalus latus]|uniref:Uncharacterized protein n=1 Tax=Dibothriocephalus latus TaxID=60516 RepID=A0A3P7P6X4_DIBLA|nr:unnamed protein product [Dibothriocephalus latus]
MIDQSSSLSSEIIGEKGTELLRLAIERRASEVRFTREAELMYIFENLCLAAEEEDEQVVHKLSSKDLKPEQIKVLQHAAGFNTSDADPLNLVAAIELLLKHFREPAETQNPIRQQITSLFMTNKCRPAIPKTEQDALRTLNVDKTIVILPEDKGRSTVVLHKAKYLKRPAHCMRTIVKGTR